MENRIHSLEIKNLPKDSTDLSSNGSGNGVRIQRYCILGRLPLPLRMCPNYSFTFQSNLILRI